MQNIDPQTLLLAVVIIAAVAVLLQAFVLLGILIALVKISKLVREKADEFRTATVPVLENSRELLQSTHSLVSRLEPRFDAAANDFAEIVQAARSQVGRLDLTVGDLQQRLHHQAVRLDGMASNVLDFVENTGNYITDSIQRPRQRVSSVLAAARAFVKGYSAPVSNPVQGQPTRVAPKPEPVPEPTPEDKNIPA
jgi:hypothetical protein